jgi:hypothetical protein
MDKAFSRNKNTGFVLCTMLLVLSVMLSVLTLSIDEFVEPFEESMHDGDSERLDHEDHLGNHSLAGIHRKDFILLEAGGLNLTPSSNIISPLLPPPKSV